ncbi:hypothetical protein [Methanothrix sp.]|uniref:hypothetical protein n=1 Tax=Methanothrix sp. TaxID=90426 RepID=UPI003C772F52
MRRTLYGVLLFLFLIEIAFAVGYGNTSPGVGSNASPLDNASPDGSLYSKSARAIDIVDVFPADEDEYLLLHNRGKEGIVLESWSLSIGNRLFILLPRIELIPDSKVELHIGNGRNSTKTEVYIGYPGPVLDDAGNVSLVDDTGSIIVEKKYP